MSDHAEWLDMGLERFLRSISYLEQTRVRIGVVGDAAARTASSGRITLGEAAIINEFGTRDIPARPFVHSALHTPLARQLAVKIAQTAVTFGDVEAALHDAGQQLAHVVRDAIYHGEFTANAAATARKKGFDHPLIDTSELADAVGHELVRGGPDAIGPDSSGAE
jgi:hypothetical protein